MIFGNFNGMNFLLLVQKGGGDIVYRITSTQCTAPLCACYINRSSSIYVSIALFDMSPSFKCFAPGYIKFCMMQDKDDINFI